VTGVHIEQDCVISILCFHSNLSFTTKLLSYTNFVSYKAKNMAENIGH